MSDFARIFKGLRVDRGLTQQELADRLGITKSTVSMYERGNRTPNFEIAEQITNFFGVDLKYLMGSTDKVERISGDETDVQSGMFAEITAEEIALIKAFRHSSEDTKAAVRSILHVSGVIK